MLTKILSKGIVGRVIMASNYAHQMAVQLVKQPLSDKEAEFLTDPKNYYEVLFYGYVSRVHSIASFANKYEAAQYQRACDRLNQFHEVQQLMTGLSQFESEVSQLYESVERINTSSNFFSKRDQTYEQFQNDVLDSIDKFKVMLEALEPYPEWRNKVIEEIGKFYHLIHNNLAESQAKRNIFLKLNRQEYFV